MMKTIVGAALGGLVAGSLALIVAGQMRAPAVDAGLFNASLTPAMAVAEAVPVPAVQCAPHLEATVQRVILDGREAAALVCADRRDAAAVHDQFAPAVALPYAQRVSYAPPPVMQPAVLTRPAPVRERVVYRESNEPDVRSRRRSVAKTAMIIGGSAGAGAGIGGMAGGKKGALIGAAIGGGAASIYEAVKR